MTTQVLKALRTTAGWAANQTEMEALYGAGNYYTTFASWEAAVPSDISASTGVDEEHVLEFYNDESSGYAAFTIDGHKTEAGNTILVTPADGDGIEGANFHDGDVTKGTFCYDSVNSPWFPNVILDDSYTTIDGLRAKKSYTEKHIGTFHNSKDISNSFFTRCIGDITGSGTDRNSFLSVRPTIQWINCIAYKSHFAVFNPDESIVYMYNCLSISGWFTILSGCYLYNCIAYDGNFYSSATSGTNNATTGTTANAGNLTNGINGISTVDGVDFVSPSTGNFKLTDTSVLKGAGIDLSSIFTDDITGYTRTVPWDIGPFAVAATGGQLLIPVALVTETEQPLPITLLKNHIVNAVTETDLAQIYTVNKAKSIGLLSELDTTLSISTDKAKSLSQTNESDSSLQISSSSETQLLQVFELDNALPINRLKELILSFVLESDTGLGVNVDKALPVLRVDESDLSLLVSVDSNIIISQTNETDDALTISLLKDIIVSLVTEFDNTLPITLRDLSCCPVSEEDIDRIANAVYEKFVAEGFNPTLITEMWKLMGLDSNNPVTTTQTDTNVDDIELDITGDGITTSTITRQ